MGYRNYIKILPKEEAEKFRHKSYEELMKEFGEDIDEPDHAYLDVHSMLGKTVTELGKYFDTDAHDKMVLENFFTNPEVEKEKEDYEVRILKPDALLTLAKHFEDNVKKHYDELVGIPYGTANNWTEEKELREKLFENKEQLIEIARSVLDRRTSWNSSHSSVVNKDKDSKTLTNSWYYEYEVFDIINLYKTIDTENNYLIIYGY